VVDIGVFSPEEFADGQRTPPSARGVVRMLQEGSQQFDIVDSKSDLHGYKLLILPDEIPVDETLFGKLDRFVRAGGALLGSWKCAKGNFGPRLFGLAKVKGDAPFSPDYIKAPRLGKGLPPTELIIYMTGLEVEPAAGTEVLADVMAPYFNPTWDHYFSHRNTPSSGRVAYPGAVQKGKCIYFMHPLFSQYAKNAPRWCKQLVQNALEHAFPDRATGHIRILLAQTERDWVVEVADDGVGVPAGTEPEANAMASDTLGLKIVRALATEDLKGGFTLRGGDGAGTRAVLTIPRVRDVGPGPTR
jgi:hypothetical protein